MDFRPNERAQNIGNKSMFGSAFPGSQVTEPAATTRQLYLPDAKWYDFWSGSPLAGGRMMEAPAPLDRLPLYIRAGSILPLGPEMEWSTEKPADPIELRIFPGADGDFTLYEDENDNYNYEKGKYATIPMHWDSERSTLTIGDRKGEFQGMLKQRTFRVVFVHNGHGDGVASTDEADKVVTYAGTKLEVRP